MTAGVLFEQRYRGDVWRLEISHHEGRTFANWRKWFWSAETLKPSREGFTFPLDRLPELHRVIGNFLDANNQSGG
jgi:hypothetical protein